MTPSDQGREDGDPLDSDADEAGRPEPKAAAGMFRAPVPWLQVGALLVLYLGLWMFTTPYAGLVHDAQAYAFQALARLDPAGLGQDIFVRYQSQDRYTIFPALYALLAAHIGVETVAAWATFVLQFCWLGAAFLVARALAGARLALLSVGLFITVPGSYGGQRVFHMAEPFLSARLPAEVISLLAIWCALRGRRGLCLALLLVSLLLHPLMAFGALLFVVILWAGELFPNRAARLLTTLLLIGGAVSGAWLLGGADATVGGAWLEVLHLRSGFLFLGWWTAADWNDLLLTLLTLALARLYFGSDRIGSVAASVLWLAIAGLLLTAISGDVWHLKILLEGQPWRWLWLARFFAIALLPVVIIQAWVSGGSDRACSMLLAAAWLFVVPGTAIAVLPQVAPSLLALLALLIRLGGPRLQPSTVVLLGRGAALALGLVVLAALTAAALAIAPVRPGVPGATLALAVLAAIKTITPAVLIVTSAWAVLARRPGVATSALVLAVGLALSALIAPMARDRWTMREFSGPEFERFADWRAIIPPTGEVFWWNGLREVWFLLHRRSYLTMSQAGGVVFSGDVVAELLRRTLVMQQFMNPRYWFHQVETEPSKLTRDMLAGMCADPVLGFVVSDVDLGTGTARASKKYGPHVFYLYDCRDYRSGPTR